MTEGVLSSTKFLDRDMKVPEIHQLSGGVAAVFSARCPGKEPPNEDAAAIIQLEDDSVVLVVADGMGGGLAGEKASSLAVQSIVGELEAEYDVGIRHPQTLEFLATAYAMQGRDDDALDMYRKAVDYHLRRRDLPDWPPPASPWERLRDDPRFAMQWERMQADLLQQGERIRMMLARYDIDELLGPTVALAEHRAAESGDAN